MTNNNTKSKAQTQDYAENAQQWYSSSRWQLVILAVVLFGGWATLVGIELGVVP